MFYGKKVVIFDMDGTLIDSVGIWNAVDTELINALGAQAPNECAIQHRRDSLLHALSHTQDAYLEYCDALRKAYNARYSKEEIRAMRYRIAKHYIQNVIDFKPDAPALLHFLREKGLTLAIASTTSQSNLHTYMYENSQMMQKVDFAETFAMILGRESVNCIKPHPHVHHHVMQTLNVTPEECLIIEDSLVGLEAARHAGIDAIIVYDRYARDDQEALKQGAYAYFDDFQTLLYAAQKELASQA
ncbi:MAG: HAD family phosphatase [Sulfurospirillum cavolei]|nr:HAD family phosphatase [Sulfurospirillum cavolei]